MKQPYPHPMMPLPERDDLSRQNFIAALKIHAEENIYPGDRVVSEQRVLPRFLATHGQPPKSRTEWRKAMESDVFVKTWSSLARTMQEMHWDTVGEIVLNDLPRLMEQSSVEKPRGSLVLDDDLVVPRYHTAIDIHCMPGGYHTEIMKDDVFAGALFDRGAYYYALPIRGASALGHVDSRTRMQRAMPGYMLIEYLKRYYPELNPRRIIDLGCSIGGTTVPYAEHFKSAEVFGVDVAAPQLRYAHARAEGLGETVHFYQENAEELSFADETFDLVVSHGLFHETSAKATPKILAECQRILRVGGVTMHVDTQFARGLDSYDQYYWDWDTHYNGEPVWGTLHSMDICQLLVAAGFDGQTVEEIWPIPKPDGSTEYVPVEDTGGKIVGSTIFSAQKI